MNKALYIIGSMIFIGLSVILGYFLLPFMTWVVGDGDAVSAILAIITVVLSLLFLVFMVMKKKVIAYVILPFALVSLVNTGVYAIRELYGAYSVHGCLRKYGHLYSKFGMYIDYYRDIYKCYDNDGDPVIVLSDKDVDNTYHYDEEDEKYYDYRNDVYRNYTRNTGDFSFKVYSGDGSYIIETFEESIEYEDYGEDGYKGDEDKRYYFNGEYYSYSLDMERAIRDRLEYRLKIRGYSRW